MIRVYKIFNFLVLWLMILFVSVTGFAQDLTITGIVDGPLSGGIPKAIELRATSYIADLSIYGIGSANNGGGTDGEEFSFPSVSVNAGEFIYVASEATGFTSFFGFAPTYTSASASINGDDAIELFMNGSVVDIFGDINASGVGQPWEYTDGWAYRVNGTGPDGSTFVLSNWSFSGSNALDNETTNAGSAIPFPIATYQYGSSSPALIAVASDANASEDGDTGEFTITRTGDASTSITVNFIIGGSAGAGDFVSFPDSIEFYTGESSKAIIVTPIDDSDTEGNETVTIQLLPVSGYDIIGGIPAIVIADNDISIIPIYTIQGPGHSSPFTASSVLTEGIVTAVDNNGFYLQDESGDGNQNTSDAIFVFTNAAPSVSVGDKVQVEGNVAEFFPGGASTGNLSTTEITSPSVTFISSGNALPAAVIIGSGGLTPPTENIDDDAFASFDPETDGIDFFESLEGMRVTIQNALAISSTNSFGEIFVVQENGSSVTGLSSRGTLNISPADFNPERLQIDEDADILPGFSFPSVDAGAQLGNVTGVINYDFGNFELHPTEAFSVTPSLLTPVVSSIPTEGKLLVASYNVLNLDPNDGDGDTDIADGRFDAIASQIINNLATPDIIGLQEIQDNSGSADNGITAADQTLQTLVDAIVNAGGPAYEFIDNTFISNNVSGGQPGANIRTAFLYNPARVSLVGGSVQTISDQNPGSPFNNARLPLVATFEFNGEELTVISNHFSSKGGSAPILGIQQPFESRQEDISVNGSLNERRVQAQAVNNFVDGILSLDATAKIVVLGDMNEFEFVSPLLILEGSKVSTSNGSSVSDTGESLVLNNLTNTLNPDERYSYNFQGNSQSLDHILVSNNLLSEALFEVVHVNSEFAETSSRASDHDPLLAALSFGSSNYRLQILHASDLEGGIDAVSNAPLFAAIVDKLEEEEVNTIRLSAGDNYIPGPFFGAAADATLRPVFQSIYQDLLSSPGLTNIREGEGRVDMTIMNIIGFDASAVGNHEFDAGPAVFETIVEEDIRGAGLGDVRWLGSRFPYLSSNLDFSQDVNLGNLYTSQILPNTDFISDINDLGNAGNVPKFAPATIITRGGQQIGIVGATTQLLDQITSNGGVEVIGPDANDMIALAEILQPVIDQLTDMGIDKIILVTHLQQLSLEQTLIGLLHDVDIVMAGGSDVLTAQGDDILRPGDVAEGTYPIVTSNADGNPAAILTSDGEYSYVGRLIVEFDDNGLVIPSSLSNPANGVFASLQTVVDNLYGSEDPFVVGSKGELVKRLTNGIETIINVQDGNILGKTDVFLEGRREAVRTEETNLGNLSADANLYVAKEYDSAVAVSIKNGGGIRAAIGEIIETSPGVYEAVPPQGNPGAGKQAGDISQLDVINSLRFNNALSIVSVTAQGLIEILEYSVSASGPGSTPGQFPQVGGVSFGVNLEFPAGSRLKFVKLIDEQGVEIESVMENGTLVGDPNRLIKIVTLNFMADGGDGYPFPSLSQGRIDLLGTLTNPGGATFATPGSEQDAMAEYLLANYSSTPYTTEDTPVEEDQRIQFVEDTFSISEFYPLSAPVGSEVTIVGSSFTGVEIVNFRGIPTTFTIVNDYTIVAIVPEGLVESGKITVKKEGITLKTETLFTPTPPVTLSISSFFPTAITQGTVVTISGTKFTGVQSVRFKGINATFTILNDSTIEAITPSGVYEQGRIKVTNSNKTVTSSEPFKFIVPEPSVAASNLQVAPAFTVARFKWKNGNGSRRLLVIKRADNPLNFIPQDGEIYPASSLASNMDPETGNYIVYNDLGNETRVTGLEMMTVYVARVFEYKGGEGRQNYLTDEFAEISFSTAEPTDPIIDNILPSCAAPGSTVIIKGRNLEETTEVTLNGSEITFTVISNNEVSVEIPESAANGNFTLVTLSLETILDMNISFERLEILPAEPDQAARNLIISELSGNSVTLNWTNGNGDKRLVVMTPSSNPYEFVPEDCDYYIPNKNYGSSREYNGHYIVFGGDKENVTVTGLSPATTYKVFVYEYNKPGDRVQNYLTSSLLQGAFTTNAGGGSSSARMAGSEMVIGEEENSASRLTVYPNPSEGKFMVRIAFDKNEDNTGVVRISDVMGRSVYEKQLQGAHLEIDLSSKVAKGTYLLQVIRNRKLETMRIIID